MTFKMKKKRLKAILKFFIKIHIIYNNNLEFLVVKRNAK